MVSDEERAAETLVRLSRWIDESAPNAGRDPEARTWGRVAKVAEECGEAVAALIGATGQNPRKGMTHSMDDVERELYDVALTALAAAEHLRGHDGGALAGLFHLLEEKATMLDGLEDQW
jgi:hypothetical protein